MAKKITEITKPMLQEFRKDFDMAVKDLAETYGVTIELGNISYSANKFSTKLSVELANIDAVKANLQTPQNKIYDMYAEQDGIKFSSPMFIGSIWESKNKKYTVMSFGRGKSPWNIVDENGTKFKAPSGWFKNPTTKEVISKTK